MRKANLIAELQMTDLCIGVIMKWTRYEVETASSI